MISKPQTNRKYNTCNPAPVNLLLLNHTLFNNDNDPILDGTVPNLVCKRYD